MRRLYADREEKRVTRGSDISGQDGEQEQLDVNDPNQRSLLGVSHACEAELAREKITQSLCLHFHMNDARRKATNARLVKNELEQALRSAIILRQFYAHRAALTNYLMTQL